MRFTNTYTWSGRKVSVKNRIALAPMTNMQSHADGCVSDEEMHWLEERARGGFGMIFTCATHVCLKGQGWPGEMGVFSDTLLPGLTELASRCKKHGSLILAQLYHGGLRSPAHLTGQRPLGPSAMPISPAFPEGGDELSLDAIHQIENAFVESAKRCERAGFSGVQLHAAHGYLLQQFLSQETNLRSDAYGGTLENRARLLMNIVRRVRQECGPGFLLSVRLSPKCSDAGRSAGGFAFAECMDVAAELSRDGVDILDYSLWKHDQEFAIDGPFKGENILQLVCKFHPQGGAASLVAGDFWDAEQVQHALDRGVNFVALGRAAIGQPDWPQRAARDPSFRAQRPPYSPAHLRDAQLGPRFIEYMQKWPGFVSSDLP